MGVEVFFAGRKHFITSDRLQILNLLLSTFGTAVQKNRELVQAQAELKKLADELEIKVQERTAALSQEVAERKQAEERTREQAMLLDEAHDGILVCELDGTIRYWNKGAEELYGWTAAEVVGKRVDELLFSRNVSQFEEALNRTVAECKWTAESKQLTKTGKVVIVDSSWTLVKSDTGEPKSILIINTDVTEQNQLQEQYLRAQRLESIGILASGIAHDLNNVLAPVLMGSQLLRMTVNDAEALASIDAIEQSARHGAELIKQILAFGRGVGGDQVEMQPGHVIRDVVKLLRETFPRSIEIKVQVPKDLWLVKAATTQIHQVLMNLSVNARDAMPNGGRLEIRCENTYVDEPYAAIRPDAKPGPYVVLIVGDTGMGIPPEVMQNLYEPFFTTKEAGKGTGLGLSTVNSIVKNHDGFIHAYSELRKGTTFRVYLPAIGSAAGHHIEQPRRDLPRGQGEYIMVVDDEPAVRRVTAATLEKYGYYVLTAENGIDGLATYVAHQQEIQLVLTDMMMPVVGGPALIRALQKIDPKVKIIALSGMVEAIDSSELAGVELIAKPFDTERLLVSVKRHLAGK